MTKALPESADDFCEDCGYEPELKRTMGSFQVFAVSFAFISVAVGIFGTYDDLLRNSGPVGIWTWLSPPSARYCSLWSSRSSPRASRSAVPPINGARDWPTPRSAGSSAGSRSVN